VAPFVNIPEFRNRITFLAFFDGAAGAAVWYWRSTRRAKDYGPAGIFLLFLLIGMRTSRQTGLSGVIAWGLSNAIFGLTATWLLLPHSKPPNGNSDPTENFK